MTASAGPALHRFHDEYGDRIRFVTLYVREAHPGNRYPQPDDFERKLQHARDYQQRDQIPWTVAVDDIDGKLHRAIDTKPDSAYVIGSDGTVLFRTLWSNDRKSMRAGLEAGLLDQQPVDAEREPAVVPMLSGLGSMYEILDQAGDVAKRDVRREVPPLYALARTASVFRPLTPIRRGVAAATLLGFGTAALAVLAVAGVRRARRGSDGGAEARADA